jgi:predicted transglutaminase-like cysteine proteinase
VGDRPVRKLLLGLALTAGIVGPAPAGVPLAVFNTVAHRADAELRLHNWDAVLVRLEGEVAVYERCLADAAACPERAVADWLRVLRGLHGTDRTTQLRAVNRYVNQVRYRVDAENFGRSDYWATPLEFFGRGGDCEDYAIAKYVSLRRLGFPPEALRLVVLKDEARAIAHAVLTVSMDGTSWVLDNVSSRVLPDARYGHYAPYYSVNEQARWIHVRADGPQIARIDPGILRGERPAHDR